jgi:predicted nucleic acid-binding protein
MSRVYWDSMLFIYLLEDHATYAPRAQHLLQRAYERGDWLCTSYLGLGEVLAGTVRSPDTSKAATIQSTLDAMGFSYLPFDERAVMPFSKLRGEGKLKIADSIHLACAAAAGVDMFLTGDRQLVGLHVPGIQFVADFETPLL